MERHIITSSLYNKSNIADEYYIKPVIKNAINGEFLDVAIKIKLFNFTYPNGIYLKNKYFGTEVFKNNIPSENIIDYLDEGTNDYHLEILDCEGSYTPDPSQEIDISSCIQYAPDYTLDNYGVSSISALSFDPLGYLWVTSNSNNKIWKINRKGVIQREFNFTNPMGVDVSRYESKQSHPNQHLRSRKIYVTQRNLEEEETVHLTIYEHPGYHWITTSYLYEYTPEHIPPSPYPLDTPQEIINWFREQAIPPDHYMQNAMDVATNSLTDTYTHVYITDPRMKRINVLNYEGEGEYVYSSTGGSYWKWINDEKWEWYENDGMVHIKRSFGKYGVSDGEFYFPYGIAIDLYDTVFVTDYELHRVQRFDKDGNFELSFGSYGTENDQFQFPMGITTDKLNNIYVCDFTGVKKYTRNGVFICRVYSGWANSVAIDPLGYPYVSTGSNIVRCKCELM